MRAPILAVGFGIAVGALVGVAAFYVVFCLGIAGGDGPEFPY